MLGGFLERSTKIECHNSDGRAVHTGKKRFEMYRQDKGETVNATPERLYNVVLHELAHCSHRELRGTSHKWSHQTDPIVKESWAIGVAYGLTRLRYSDHEDYDDLTFEQMTDPPGIGFQGNRRYTSLIIDLLDTENQGIDAAGIADLIRPNDILSGYTLEEIEDVLGNCQTIICLRDNLRNSYDNFPSENSLNVHFDQYINFSR